jgi:sugar lactone lactonase YvrE
VVWHPDGRVLVADQSNHCIRAIALDGSVTTLAGVAVEAGTADGPGSTARFTQPRALTLDPLGHLYVAESDRIRQVSPEGLVTTVFAPQTAPAGLGRLRSPGGLALDLRGGLWVADSGNHRILEILPDGTANIWAGREAGFADGLAGEALLNQPGGLAFAGDETLIIADTRNHRLRRLLR